MTTASFARSAGYSIPADAAARLARLRKLAWLLDAQFRLPGTGFRFGVNSLFGLLPISGDVLLGLVSLYLVWEARALGAPPALLGRMLANILVEVVGGAIPVLGDLFDMAFKANLRNLALLEEFLRAR
jgi:hypothetical protein